MHRSYSYENGQAPTNERLEFLGDAIVGFIVTDALYRAHPDADEGRLSRMRVGVVSGSALAQVGRALGVGEALLLGRGEDAQGGRDKDSILADATEALIGAVFLAHGLDITRDVVLRIAAPLLRRAGTAPDGDHKTVLQLLAAELGRPAPRYETDADGPVHARTFAARVLLGDEVAGTAVGRTKKAAEQAAAAVAVEALRAR